MVRSLLFSFILFSTFRLTAQFSSSPAPVMVSVQPTSGELVTDVIFSKSGDSTYTIFWKLEKNPSTFESAWEIYVCDLNLCYTPAIESCPPSKPNVFSNNSNLFQFHFKPNGVAGSSVVGVKLYADKNFTQEVYSTTINISSTISSTKDLNNVNIKVFPNPATDYFQVTNGSSIKKVVLYNMFGKEIKTYFHYNNAQHEISELKTGMYIVKMLDDKNKVIKSLKLNKSFGGA